MDNLFIDESYPNKDLFSLLGTNHVSPIYITLEDIALFDEIIDKDRMLSMAVSNLRVDGDLISVALPLRYGANPNLYINDRHILSSVFDDRKLQIDFIHLLIVAGSDSSMNVNRSRDPNRSKDRDPNRSKDRDPNRNRDAIRSRSKDAIRGKSRDAIRGKSRNAIRSKAVDVIRSRSRNAIKRRNSSNGSRNSSNDGSVKSWLITNYPWMEKVKRKGINKIHILLDIYTSEGKYNVETLIKYRCINIFKERFKIDQFHLAKISIRQLYEYCIKYYNEPIFSEIMTRIKPFYRTMTDLFRKRINNEVLRVELDSMILTAVKVGVYIDLYQTELRNVKGLIKAYEVPRWTKGCSSVRSLAYNVGLNIEQSSHELCRQLGKVIEHGIENDEALTISKLNVMKRERDKIILSTLNDSILPCNGVTSYASLEYYVDKSEKIWCFKGDQFDSLVESKVNPNDENLPQAFIRRLERRVKLLKEYDINYKVSISIEQAISDINRKDVISNDRTDRIVSEMKQVKQVKQVKPVSKIDEIVIMMTIYEELTSKNTKKVNEKRTSNKVRYTRSDSHSDRHRSHQSKSRTRRNNKSDNIR